MSTFQFLVPKRNTALCGPPGTSLSTLTFTKIYAHMLLPTTCKMIFILLEVRGEEKGLSFDQTIDLSFCGHPGTSVFL